MHIQHGIKAWLFAGLISAFAGGAIAHSDALWPQDIADGTVNNPQAESLQQALGNVSTVTRQGPPGRP